MSTYSPYHIIMNFAEHLDFLIDVRNHYRKWRTSAVWVYPECIGGDSTGIIKGIQKYINIPPEKMTPIYWHHIGRTLIMYFGEKIFKMVFAKNYEEMREIWLKK